MTIPEAAKDGLAKDSQLTHNSLQEASKMNEEIGDLNLDGPVEKAEEDEKTSLNKSKLDDEKSALGAGELSK